jgi:hypothetical protein
VNLRRLRIWEWITGLAGAALLASLFLDWYDADGLGPVSGWEAFSVLDVLLAIAALMGIAVAVMAAAHDSPAVSLAIASLLLLVGSIVTIALVVRVISGPEVVVHGVTAPDDEVTRAIGLWLGLAAASLTTLGALASMRDERFPEAARLEVPVETLPPPEGGKA